MKVYITKYSLTEGIIEKEAEQFTETGVKTVNEQWPQYFHKPYWHETMQDALKHADELRIKKIASLKKQIAKLEKLTFNQ